MRDDLDGFRGMVWACLIGLGVWAMVFVVGYTVLVQ